MRGARCAVVRALAGSGGAADDLSTGASASASAVRVDPPLRQVTIIASGDVLTESRVRATAADAGATIGARFDFAPMFQPVAATIREADLAICNQELPISEPGGRFGFNGRSLFGGNRLLSPYEVAAGLAATGFNRCSTASNHSLDGGLVGIATTINALNAAGISTVGTARTPTEALPAVVDTGQALVGHLAITRSLNDPQPSDAWRLNVRPSAGQVVADAGRLRQQGADVVVVALHIGTERLAGPTTADRGYVTAIASSGQVDAVFIHGPHVVQPFEMVGSTAVWWSLGNFVSEMGPPSIGRYATPGTSDGLLARVEFVRDRNGRWSMTPSSIALCNDFEDRTVRRPTEELARGVADPRIRTELEACLARTRALVPDAQ